LHQFSLSIREDLLPRLLIPNAELFQGGNQNDIALKISVLPQRWRDENASLLVQHTLTCTAQVKILKHQHTTIEFWSFPNFLF
jgi:hypothetical protein